jgi:hypothetical protein
MIGVCPAVHDGSGQLVAGVTYRRGIIFLGVDGKSVPDIAAADGDSLQLDQTLAVLSRGRFRLKEFK